MEAVTKSEADRGVSETSEDANRTYRERATAKALDNGPPLADGPKMRQNREEFRPSTLSVIANVHPNRPLLPR
jgi:hypothetical protein